MRVAWAAWLLMCAIAEPAIAQPAASGSPNDHLSAARVERQAERDRIQNDLQAIEAVRARGETACYRRFAVEECLRDVRIRARDAERQLRARDLQINDAERKEKAAERLRSIEEKQRLAEDRPQPQGNVRGAEGVAPTGVDELRSQHQREAQQRAEQQRTRQQSGAMDHEQRAKENAERAAAARAGHAENVKSAQERRERIRKKQADSAAAGGKPAAPLPASSGLPLAQP